MSFEDPWLKKNVFVAKDHQEPILFKKGETVQLHGLKTSVLNGKHAVIIGEAVIGSHLNKRWPIQLKDDQKKMSIKEINLKIEGDVNVVYETLSVSDGLTEFTKEFKIYHKITKQHLYELNLRKNVNRSIKFQTEIADSHHHEIMCAYKWHCVECRKYATRMQSFPMSYLHNDPPVIIGHVFPV
eukprot:98732_1